ncbi:LAQU0S01e10924g1_1 [Lachancea quebecensis]|uniref:LAQU0S01e10924g1_1 n=1 Tax=Lachancea quebecensis TaxID=1654605 RepID=A0A0P1KLI0_9SACH|nr:LAQU0S01e10924g1_1 [Lachancea quebecensis]
MLFGPTEDQRLSFVSGNGKTVHLRKKPAKDVIDLNWKHDESYGIDINQLLQRCEDTKNAAKQGPVPGCVKHSTSQLWTEKWKPRTFFDLVGNEKTNRRVLKWLRQWSPLVFGQELPKKSSSVREKLGADGAVLDFEDPLQRPYKKILLLNGPPGIGKTSVAHVVAKQAGFSVIEINASDERAGPHVKDRIHNALFNHTFDDRPVCLIADEIDGSIETGFVKVLIDIVNSDFRATQRLASGASNTVQRGKRKQRSSGKVLTRPIITICNNVYASALEKLRPHCEIITFQRPAESALLERLSHVCRKEKLQLGKKRLKELSELSQGDLRSCLNNMQFMASLQAEAPESADAVQISDQVKDMAISWYRICNQIFRRNPHEDAKVQFGRLLRDVEINSNYQRIVQGCFAMFPEVKFSDHSLQKPSAAADWLYFNDLMFKSLFEHNGDLLRYNSVVPMAFFNLFSDIANKDDVRGKVNEFDHRERLRNNDSIVLATLHRAPPILKIFMNKSSLALEVLPLLDYILVPDFSKVRNNQIKTALLNNIVAALSSFDLSFSERVDTDLPRVTCIEPPFDKVTLMDEKRVKEVFTKRPSILNVVLAKAQESKVRKRTIEQAKVDKLDLESARKKHKTTSSKPVDYFKAQYANVQTKGNETIEDSGCVIGGSREPVKIWIKYKEGFSDAVRKDVTWNSLWE